MDKILLVEDEASLAMIVSDTLAKEGFDAATRMLWYHGKGEELSHFESVILQELLSCTGETVDASVLMQLVWQRDDIYNRNSLHGFIHKLRRHLRHDSSISIINLRGIGYKLVVGSGDDG